jgi:hypothetical protein
MPFLFYEGKEGGHAFGLTVEELATHDALVYTYLAERSMPNGQAGSRGK